MLLAVVTFLENTSNRQECAVWHQKPLLRKKSLCRHAGTKTATDAVGKAEDDVHWAFDDQEEMPDEDGGPGEAGGGGGDLRSPCLECHTAAGVLWSKSCRTALRSSRCTKCQRYKPLSLKSCVFWEDAVLEVKEEVHWTPNKKEAMPDENAAQEEQDR